MIASPQQRQFTAALRKQGFGSANEATSERATRAEQVARWHTEILEAIADVRQRIAMIAPAERRSGGPTAAFVSAPDRSPGVLSTASDLSPGAPPPVDDARQAEMLELMHEVQALEKAIAQTRQEIAALRQLGKPPATLSTATDELDAVVQATEGATECILNASERIDELVGRLRIQAADSEERTLIEEIGEHVTHIFEACNFQDITGQRLTKVVGAMKFIEERVERMMQILGGSDAFAGLEAEAPPPPGHAAEDEAHLLEGPQLEEHKISQDDIDAFFN